MVNSKPMYEYVKEPLSDPANTLESLLTELLSQAVKAARPMGDTPGGIVADLKKKTGEIAECLKAHKAIKTEILRRFDAEKARADAAEQRAIVAEGSLAQTLRTMQTAFDSANGSTVKAMLAHCKASTQNEA